MDRNDSLRQLRTSNRAIIIFTANLVRSGYFRFPIRKKGQKNKIKIVELSPLRDCYVGERKKARFSGSENFDAEDPEVRKRWLDPRGVRGGMGYDARGDPRKRDFRGRLKTSRRTQRRSGIYLPSKLRYLLPGRCIFCANRVKPS